MEELIKNNLAQMQLDGDPEIILRSNEKKSVDTLDQLYENGQEAEHPCMDGMWY